MTAIKPPASVRSVLRSREASRAAPIRMIWEKRLSLPGRSAPRLSGAGSLGGCVTVGSMFLAPRQLTVRRVHETYRAAADRDDAGGETRATQHDPGFAYGHWTRGSTRPGRRYPLRAYR